MFNIAHARRVFPYDMQLMTQSRNKKIEGTHMSLDVTRCASTPAT